MFCVYIVFIFCNAIYGHENDLNFNFSVEYTTKLPLY